VEVAKFKPYDKTPVNAIGRGEIESLERGGEDRMDRGKVTIDECSIMLQKNCLARKDLESLAYLARTISSACVPSFL
jgi:hypothetical protein